MKKLILALAICSLSSPAFAGKILDKASKAVESGVENAQEVAEDAVPEVEEKSALEKAKGKFKKSESNLSEQVQKAAKKKAEEAVKAL